MSETDDTDELILIPPDFFVTADDLEESFLSGPYYNVVDTLISQVNHLENRLNSIEKSDVSNRNNLVNYSVDPITKIELMSNIRKCNSTDDVNKVIHDVYYESTQSTPQKPQTRFKLNSYSSINRERYSPRKTFLPTEINQNTASLRNHTHTYEHKNDAAKDILQEIDQYICNIQTNSDKFRSGIRTENLLKNRLNLKDLDYILQKVDLQTKEIDKQINLNKNKLKHNENYVPNFEYRKNSNGSEQILPSDISSYNDSNGKTESISSNSEPTQLTTLPNTNLLKAGSDYNCGSVATSADSFQVPQQKYVSSSSPIKQESQNFRKKLFQSFPIQNQKYDQNEHRLLSLSHLWTQGDVLNDYIDKEDKILQKLEEEKLRRQHCEQLIQNLQSKTLELQEKLAVAVQVDEAKDDAILRFHSSWQQIAERLQVLTKDRNELEHEISILQTQCAENVLEATKKINHLENEASKALTLVQSTQEIVGGLENRISEITERNHLLNAKIEDSELKYKTEVEANRNLLDQLEQKNIELHENNNSLAVVKNEIANSKRAIELCQIELTSLRTQNSHLEIIVNEKDDIVKSMERHNQKLLNEIDTHKKIEKDLQHELNKAKESNEKNKVDLRNFYQDQVEIVVREKLKEFQSQLANAESSLLEELRKREITIAKSAANHIQQINDKHSLEIKLLEERHNEEVRLYQVKLSQALQHIETLQSKLNLQYQKKTDMAKQLHRVMEAQWLEALKIINNGKSPTVSNNPDVTINQLNILKTKSHSNLEEVLSVDSVDDQEKDNITSETIMPPLHLAATTSSIQEDSLENFAYFLNAETPLTSRPKTKQQIEQELQKYVQMLLNKQPGDSTNISTKLRDNDVQEMPTWQSNNQDDNLLSKGKQKKMKRPWK